MRSIGILCARGASKRLPRKHLRQLLGLPLVAWMCRAAAASGLDRVVITTEDAEIAAVAAANGAEAPFLRPAHLAQDYAADYDIVVHALDFCEQQEGKAYDAVVMLQPTTPFTTPADIDGCLEMLSQDAGIGCCFTARPVTEPAQWMFVQAPSKRAERLLGDGGEAHKQLLPPAWFPSGAAYAMRTDAFRAQRKIYAEPLAFYPMQSERSVDIDEALDLMLAECVGRERGYTPTPLTGSGQ